MMQPILLWFTRDLRLADHPALDAAARGGDPIVALFVLDDASWGSWARGAASRWFLAGALEALASDVRDRGGRLVLRRGRADEVVASVARAVRARAVFWTRHYDPWGRSVERRLEARLGELGVEARAFPGFLIREPQEVLQRDGEPYRVFTPFSRAWLAHQPPHPPLPVPARIAFADLGLPSETVETLALRPTKPDWARGLRACWDPSERGAEALLERFLEGPVWNYARDRDFPARAGGSRLSPHLAIGTVSPRRVYWAALARAEATGRGFPAVWPFVRQLVWREFAWSNLFHFPELPDRPLRREFEAFPWAIDARLLRAWQKGRTGYPIVDAGMRELWTTGWMHNRVRMIVGSFLTKDLRIPWQEGERWFWDTLVDADLANNAMGWQWVAGCGIDAAPYFRIFNPVLQAKKFDPEGDYVRRWVPELARLPAAWIHEPWKAPPLVLEEAGVRLGLTYPPPIVDHEIARKEALDAFAALRTG
ncbi:MAG: DNA photolyase family protein [Geminicoccaceae bacterium]|nr:DNA photolyase family protein [Geminicoccaceae bacterium]